MSEKDQTQTPAHTHKGGRWPRSTSFVVKTAQITLKREAIVVSFMEGCSPKVWKFGVPFPTYNNKVSGAIIDQRHLHEEKVTETRGGGRPVPGKKHSTCQSQSKVCQCNPYQVKIHRACSIVLREPWGHDFVVRQLHCHTGCSGSNPADARLPGTGNSCRLILAVFMCFINCNPNDYWQINKDCLFLQYRITSRVEVGGEGGGVRI